MANRIPIVYNAAQNQLEEMQAGDVLPVSLGGTGAANTTDALTALGAASEASFSAHVTDTNNPHGVTAAQVGAPTVAAFDAHTADSSNPHNVTAAQVGAPTVAAFNAHATSTANPHNVTAAQVGAPTQAAFDAHTTDVTNPHNVTAAQVGAPTQAAFNAHTSDTNNPHNVTAAQVGAPTQAAFDAHTADTNNPHGVTAAQVGAPTQAAFDAHTTNTSNPHNVTASQVGGVAVTTVGQPNGVAPLDAGGKIPATYLPAAALPQFYVVADAAARLALTVQEGDEAYQQDDGSSWIFDGASWFNKPSASGNVTSAETSSVDGELVLFSGVTGTAIKKGSGLVVTAPGELNGRDISADGTALDQLVAAVNTHTSDTNNPHGVTAAQVGSYTTAEVDGLLDKPYAQASSSATITFNNPVTIDWDVEDLTNNLTHDTVASPDVWTLSAGVYEIFCKVTIDNNGNARRTSRTVLLLDNAEVTSTAVYGYHRNSAVGKNSVSFSTLINVTGATPLSVQVESLGGPLLLLGPECSLTIKKVQ